jgi:hypothetical protein
MTDRNVVAAQRHFDSEEAANEAACYETAAKYGVKQAQAELCDDSDIGCLSCPFRDPRKRPITGDLLRFANGRVVIVEYVNMEHTVRPEIQYRFEAWKRHHGGRAAYAIPLADWPKKADGAEIIRRGPHAAKAYQLAEIRAAAKAKK